MLRILSSIFLILFVAGTIYVTKDDALLFFQSFINEQKNKVEVVDPKTEETDPTFNYKTPETQEKVISTPGALQREPSTISGGIDANARAKEIIRLTNLARIQNGVYHSLSEQKLLNKSAQIKLDDMFTKNYFEHVSPSGVSVSNLGDSVGYDFIMIGENLALGDFTSEQEIVDAWMASPGHRANILNAKYKDIGVSIGYGTFNGKETLIAVQHFGLSLDVCPPIDSKSKEESTIYKQEIEKLSTQIGVLKDEINGLKEYDPKYNQKVREYNDLIKEYNNLVELTKKKIEAYNTEVNLFNSCLAKFN